MSTKREGFPTPLLREKVLEIQERVLALIELFLVQFAFRTPLLAINPVTTATGGAFVQACGCGDKPLPSGSATSSVLIFLLV